VRVNPIRKSSYDAKRKCPCPFLTATTCAPSAAWRLLTIASPRTIPSRDAANSVSVLYFRVPYHSSSPSRRLTTRPQPPHYLLILISRTFSVLWSFSLSRSLYRTDLRPNHVDQCDLLHAQGTGEGTFSFPARQGRIPRYVRYDGAISLSTPRVSRPHGLIVFYLCGAIVAHDVGWIVSGFFTVIAIVTSFWLINKHLQWYTNVRPFGSARLICSDLCDRMRRNESSAVGVRIFGGVVCLVS
jgi:hypothetical protein